YLGLSKNPNKRFQQHKHKRSDKGSKLGDVLRYINDEDQKPLVFAGTYVRGSAKKVEKEYIARYMSQWPNGFNMSPGGEGGNDQFDGEYIAEKIGRRFGLLTVRDHNEPESTKRGYLCFDCHCSGCGEMPVIGIVCLLRDNGQKSCGACSAKEQGARLVAKTVKRVFARIKFGCWTAKEWNEKRTADDRCANGGKSEVWIDCVCDCGREECVRAGQLLNNRSKGCLSCSNLTGAKKTVHQELKKFINKIMLIGKFDLWTVDEYNEKASTKQKPAKSMFDCHCVCGETQCISGTSLLRGETKGCASCSKMRCCDTVERVLSIKFFGQLEAISRNDKLSHEKGHNYIEFICHACNGHVSLRATEMARTSRQVQQSCGCQRTGMSNNLAKAKTYAKKVGLSLRKYILRQIAGAEKILASKQNQSAKDKYAKVLVNMQELLLHPEAAR
ncbi:hypothetical protein LCGC14_2611700, partial [marine sediment metagenome]